jgi:hypothetical protein
VRRFILGTGTSASHVAIELWLISALICMTAISALIWTRRSELLRAAGTLLVCYLLAAVALYAIPRATWTHHWIIGTPFQYLSITLAAAGLWRISKELGTNTARLWSGCFSALLVGLIVSRVMGVVSLEQSLLRGDAAQRWNPSLTRFGELMSQHTDEAMVVTAGWGLAPQAYCLSGGPPNFVHDLYWTYERTTDITNRLEATNRRAMFVARPEWKSLVRGGRGRRIWSDLDSIGGWAPGWREVEVSGELRELDWITVRKFVRSSSP